MNFIIDRANELITRDRISSKSPVGVRNNSLLGEKIHLQLVVDSAKKVFSTLKSDFNPVCPT